VLRIVVINLQLLNYSLRIVESPHLKMSATEQSVNTKCSVVIHRSTSETMGMLDEAYGNEYIKQMQDYE
jgi:hypothetical protein